MTCRPLVVWPVSTPRQPGEARSAASTLGNPSGGACAGLGHVQATTAARVMATAAANVRTVALFMIAPPLRLGHVGIALVSEHPSVLCEARSRPFLEIGRFEPGYVVDRHGTAEGRRIYAVHARGVQAQDLSLDVGGEGLIAEALHERFRHGEAAQRLDLPLGRSPPDGVRAPQHV